MTPPPPHPIIIIGAGISGLLLAHFLSHHSIPFQIYERRPNLNTLNEGWGLTLHWSLPTLRELMGEALFARLPETYVDRGAVERGEGSRFPFFDLSTGEEKARTPVVGEGERVRVGRQALRRLLAGGLNIMWGKTYLSHTSSSTSVTAYFDDGSQSTGILLLGCDGAHSRVRRTLHPHTWTNHSIPICVMGLKADFSPPELKPLLDLDPFFLQATSPHDNTYIYFSVLSPPSPTHPLYTIQIVVSWPASSTHQLPLDVPPSNAQRYALLQSLSSTWADPFRSLIRSLPPTTDTNPIHLEDWLPRKAPAHPNARVALLGDAFHPMAMYRGDGANHAVRDVWELVGGLGLGGGGREGEGGMKGEIGNSIEAYEGRVIRRTAPAVRASRRAALDAHCFERIREGSPLFSRRVMVVEFEEEGEGEGEGEV